MRTGTDVVQEKDPMTGSNGSSTNGSKSLLTEEEGERAILSLQRIVQFPTVAATAVDTGAYVDCANFLIQELNTVEVFSEIHSLPESPPESPVVIACWKGQDESLPVILLNSHYDVVPAAPEDWTVDPFKGERKDGKVYGRGTQDMKCVCIQYIEAIRKIHSTYPDFQPARSIYLTFVPDEEVGGAGMAAFLESTLYKDKLPGIALALDEGLASTDDVFSVFYGERLPWWISVKATGNTGHGSRFIQETAVEQLVELANKALAFREGQRQLLHGHDHHHSRNCSHAVAASKKRTLGDVTSLNITTLEAGVRVGGSYAYNCVPPVAQCSLDIRISPHVEPREIKDMLDSWCRDCSKGAGNGRGLTWNYIGGHGNDLQKHATTDTDAKVNPWYGVFCDSLTGMGYQIHPQVFPAATDSRFLRALGIRALGFSPMRNTEILLHENDEYLPESTFVEGINVYVGLIRALASQTKAIDTME